MKRITSVLEVIRARRSVRHFSDREVERDIITKLEEWLEKYGPGYFKTGPKFRIIKASDNDREKLNGIISYGIIRGAKNFIVGRTKKNLRAFEDFGYVLQHVILECTALGIGTCWIGGTFSKSRVKQLIELEPDEHIPAIIAIGYPSENRDLKERMMRKCVHGDVRKPWRELFFADNLFVPILAETPPDPQAYDMALEMLRWGPSASNHQPWRVVKDERNGAYHFFVRRNSGIIYKILHSILQVGNIQSIDMGIAMCHFELAAKELGLPGQWQNSPPAWISDLPDNIEYVISWMTNDQRERECR
ncbi:MAG: nitroreductase family protein [Candidatus Riflebacteria bacterium]|nr:nitroreductase family protein [Candidatus Riflebacteria bacterium]